VAAILFYLARRYPEAQLWPDGNLETEAQIISWMSFIAATVQPSRGRGIERAREVFGIADARMGDKEWVVGSYSIADIHLFRLYWRFLSWFHLAPEEFPNLGAHYHRMIARPAVQRTLEVEAAIGYELSG
jgi:glutathione S-transferase